MKTKRKWRRATGDDTFDGYCLVEDGQDTPAVVSKIHHADGVHFQWYLIYGGAAVSSYRDFASAKLDGVCYHEAVVMTTALEAAEAAVSKLDRRAIERLERAIRNRRAELEEQKDASVGKKRARRRRRAC